MADSNMRMSQKRLIIRAFTVSQSLAFVRDFLPGLMEKYDVKLLCSPEKPVEELEAECHAPVIPVEMHRRFSPLKDLASLRRIVRVFRDERPYMVHSMTPKAGLLCMLAGWLTRVPLRVHTFTGLVFPTSTGLSRKILMLTDRITCACATHIIPEGEGVKSDLLNYGITKKPLRVLGYGNVKGVDMEFYSRRPEVMEIVEKNSLVAESCVSFVFVGRIVRDKGINELCQAFDRLSRTEKVHLVLVGPYEDGLDPISEESKQIIKENSCISAVGSKQGDELLAYYAAADCYVFPSYREGFPNTVLEAGAMGLPSIVTDINGSREIIKDGENGVIIPSHDVDALYEAMRFMVNNDEARRKMADNARGMIQSRFDRKFVQQCLFDYYDELDL